VSFLFLMDVALARGSPRLPHPARPSPFSVARSMMLEAANLWRRTRRKGRL
jgi:hypothetical protein